MGASQFSPFVLFNIGFLFSFTPAYAGLAGTQAARGCPVSSAHRISGAHITCHLGLLWVLRIQIQVLMVMW